MDIHNNTYKLYGISDKRGNTIATNIVDIEGVPEPDSIYMDVFEYENFSSNSFDWNYSSETNEALNTQYMSSGNLKGGFQCPKDFMFIRANNFYLPSGETLSVSRTGQNFSGTASPGVNAIPNFTWAVRGGDGNAYSTDGSFKSMISSSDGGIGFSGAANLAGNTIYGGGMIVLVAEKIFGSGTIVASGTKLYASGTEPVLRGGSGGGMIVILTKEWSGEIGLNVSNGGWGAQDGSYAIVKINQDNTLTLMVHSQNGVSADLNGQTPVHGADASISW